MFDIGFWELVVIAVVTLLVVGPDEFPTVVRKVSTWVNDVRKYVSAVKADFDREIEKAEELKKLIAKEVKVAEMHKEIDETQTSIPVNYHQLRKRPSAQDKARHDGDDDSGEGADAEQERPSGSGANDDRAKE